MAIKTVRHAKPTDGARARAQAAGPRKARDERYHHGDLHQALLRAAEAVLQREGLQGLTLRAVAREAHVSHAAPTHHFDDLTGLVSELAAIGFQRFNAAMGQAGTTAGTPNERAMARAKAYIAYARANPKMYGLMFRTERLDMSRPALREAANASFASLTRAVSSNPHAPIADALTLEQAAEIAKAWSLIHGFATLLIDGRLQGILERLPSGDIDRLLEATLRAAIVKS